MERRKPHFAYIECVRGYAVLLVIVCHASYLLPDLPYPVHRVAVLGWHGVQLFFLASAVTLTMSWRYEKLRTGTVDVPAFFIRRFFRIAPAYYVASVLYFVLEPPAGGFDPLQAAATFLFVNAWHPVLMGVAPNAWNVVPGSWSIGVEFTFYALFPVVAAIITSLSRAIYLLLATLIVGATMDTLFWGYLKTAFGAVPADNFLYFWFLNQMSVFALGLCLFFLLEQDRVRRSIFADYPDSIAALSAVGVAAMAFVALPHWLNWFDPRPPAFIAISLALMVFILALARARPRVFLNAPAALLGRVSFSAYLLHFAVLKFVSGQPVFMRYLSVTGWPAIAIFAILLAGVVPLVLAVSWCSYRAIELPMTGLGKTLIRQRRLTALQEIS